MSRTAILALVALVPALGGAGRCQGPGLRMLPLRVRSDRPAPLVLPPEAARHDAVRRNVHYLDLRIEAPTIGDWPGIGKEAWFLGVEVRGLLGGGRAVRTVVDLGPGRGAGSLLYLKPHRYLGEPLEIAFRLARATGPRARAERGRLEALRDALRAVDPADFDPDVPGPKSRVAGQLARLFESILLAPGREVTSFALSLVPLEGREEHEPDRYLTAGRYVILLLRKGDERHERWAAHPEEVGRELVLHGGRLAWKGAGQGAPRPYLDTPYLVLVLHRHSRLPDARALRQALDRAERAIARGGAAVEFLKSHRARFVTALAQASGRLSVAERAFWEPWVGLLDARILEIEARGRGDPDEELAQIEAQMEILAQIRKAHEAILLDVERNEIHARVRRLAARVARLRIASGLVSDAFRRRLQDYRRFARPPPGAVPAAAPELSSIEPEVSRDTVAPEISGRAEPGATVTLYRSADCSGPAAHRITAGDDGSFRVSLEARANATTRFSARAREGASGEDSACSNAVRFVHDDRPPEAPVVLGTDPPSPSRRQPSPRVLGTAEPGAEVWIYAEPGCAGAALGSGRADAETGAFAVRVQVPPDRPVRLHARARDRAGNVSACAASAVGYWHKTRPPPPPVLAKAVRSVEQPGAPFSVLLEGTAEAGATVEVFAAQGCPPGGKRASAIADSAGRFQATVPVSPDRATVLSARATDAAGGESGCSARFDYLPPPSLDSAVAAKGPDGKPLLRLAGSAPRNTTVSVWGAAGCAGPALGAGPVPEATGRFEVGVPYEASAQSILWVQARSPEGPVSECRALVFARPPVSTAPAAGPPGPAGARPAKSGSSRPAAKAHTP